MTIFPYKYINSSYIPIKEDIDKIIALNVTNTIVSGSDGTVYSCNYSGKFKCDSILETSSKNLLFRNEKMNQVYIISREKSILYTFNTLHTFNSDTMKLINSTNFY